MKLTAKQRAELFNRFGGRCGYCGSELPEKGWHADHIEAVIRKTEYVRVDLPHQTYKAKQTGELRNPQADHAGNMMPSCRACNIDKMTLPLECWRRRLEDLAANCRRNHSAFRHAERFGLVAEVKKPVVFWFEQAATEPSHA